MKQINSARDLHEAIGELEQKKAQQLLALEHQFSDVYENLKPGNLIKHTLQSAFGSGESKQNILGSVIGLGTGFLSKRLLVGKSVGFFRKAIGTAVELGVAGMIGRVFRRKKMEKLN